MLTNTLRFVVLDVFVLYYLMTQAKINISLFEAISELSLKKSLTTVLDQLPDSVVIADVDGIRYLNRQAWKHLGCVDECLPTDEESKYWMEPKTMEQPILCFDERHCKIIPLLEML